MDKLEFVRKYFSKYFKEPIVIKGYECKINLDSIRIDYFENNNVENFMNKNKSVSYGKRKK